MSRPPGILGLNAKLADAAPHARVCLAALVELLSRDAPLRRELYAAVGRSTGFMFWPRLIPRPALALQDEPRRAQGAQQPAPRPAGLGTVERAPEREPDAALARYPAPVPAPATPAPTPPTPTPAPAPAARRGALPRRAAAAPAGDGLHELQALVAERLGGAP